MQPLSPDQLERLSAEEQITLFQTEKHRLSPISPSLVGFIEAGGKTRFDPFSPAGVGVSLTGAALESAKRAARGQLGGSQGLLKDFRGERLSLHGAGRHLRPRQGAAGRLPARLRGRGFHALAADPRRRQDGRGPSGRRRRALR